MILTDSVFRELISAASMAPSSDNLQPWEFRKRENSIEVFCVKNRLLAIDVRDMFSWISIGAAIQNIVVTAAAGGLEATVEYEKYAQNGPDAVIRFTDGERNDNLAGQVRARTTNRRPFHQVPLNPVHISNLSDSKQGMNGGIHWLDMSSVLDPLVAMDAVFSSVLLEHKPFFDGLFDTIRFTEKEMETSRCGMDIKSLDIPLPAAFIASRLKHLKINRLISRLGIGPVVARILSSRLRKTGGVCLITAKERGPAGYMEAGRVMERLWLTATAEGLSVHPYGVIPQYLTMAELNPAIYLPEQAARINSYRDSFFSIFSGAVTEYPVIMFRIGLSRKQSARTTIRFRTEQIIRN